MRAPFPTTRGHPPHAAAGLARALSKLGYCSRSQAVDLIHAGRVTVNGRPCRDIERRVALDRDRLEVDDQPVQRTPRVYLALNKPRGLVTTRADERGRPTVYTLLEGRGLPPVMPVGRLDQASEGLLLFTNDTAWGAALTDPLSHLAKVYSVQVDCLADEKLLGQMTRGIECEGDFLRAQKVQLIREGTRNSWIEVVLDEGKNRHIRRLLSALGVSVLRLIRTAIGPLQLGDLEKGGLRQLTRAEVESLRQPASLQDRRAEGPPLNSRPGRVGR